MSRCDADRHAALSLAVLLLCGCQAGPDHPTPSAHLGPVTGLAPTGDGFASCSQAGVRMPGGLWIAPPFRCFAIAVGPNHLVAAGGTPGERGLLACFDATGHRIAQREVGKDVTYTVALHPQRPLLATGGADGRVLLLALPDLRTLRELRAHTAPCRDVAFSPDGRRLASAGRDGLVFVHDVDLPGTKADPNTGTGAGTTVLSEHTAGVECVDFVGDTIVSGALDGKVRLHRDGRLIRTYTGMDGPVRALARCDSDGRTTVYVGLAGGTIRVLSPEDDRHRLVSEVPGPLFSLAAAGKTLIAGLGGGIVGVPIDTPDE